MPTLVSRRSILTCTLPLFLLASLRAQTPAQDPHADLPAIRSKVTVVLVDVVVTDGKGDAITGLHKEDLELLEDGKPQTMSSFDEHHAAVITPVDLPKLPAHVYTNYPVIKSADSINVLLLDALNTPTGDQFYVHSQMIKYLKTIPPGTRVAIFTLASRLRMLQGVTTDSSQLLAVLNNAKAGPQASPVLPSANEDQANRHLIDFMTENASGPSSPNTTIAQAAVDPINSMKQFLADTASYQTESRVRITLQAMQQLARYLSDVPCRKNVIWFSGSFPVNVAPDPDVPDPFTTMTHFQDEIRKTSDLLAAAQMAVYPIAAEGLATDTTFEANGQEIGEKRGNQSVQDQILVTRAGNAERDSSHVVMEDLAKATGGHAFYNTNGLNDALARVVNNGTRYYSMSYAPTNGNMDGKYRRIQLRLVNGKGTMAYRRGYYADDLGTALAANQNPDSDPLLPLMGRNLPDYTQIIYEIRILPSDPQPAPDAPRVGSNTDMKGPIVRYGVDFAISMPDLKLDLGSDGVRHGLVELVLVAYDRDGKPLNFVVSKNNLLLKPDVYATMQQVGLQLHKDIDVPKDYVYLRTGIYDLKASTAGTMGIPLNASVAAKAN
jgi:VWFA-related protein